MDYKKIGFKAGIEIHQQLESNKLFCSCPSIVNDPNPTTIIVKRKLRAVAGETDKVDIAARYEKQKDKEVIYEAKPTSSCLVELDEEPPHDLNEEALETVLQVALLLNANIVDKIQFMRKTIVDGSLPSGFQRTALIATDGEIETSKGKVKILTIMLEEEAAKKIKETPSEVTFGLDRLGVPLIEVTTGPNLKDPEHVKEAASLIGMILRSTERVKRGIGSIRQDVNVNIKTHPRVELKGFQDLRAIPKVVENEIKRQLSKKGKEIPHVRKVNPDLTTTFLRPMPGSARLYPETDIRTIEITPKILKTIKIPELITEKAIKLEKGFKLNSQLAHELVPKQKFFKFLVKKYIKTEPRFIAQVLIEYPKEIKKRYNLKVLDKHVEDVLGLFHIKKITRDGVFEVLIELAKGKKVRLDKYKIVPKHKIEKEIKEIIKKHKDITFNAIMGEVMKKFRGKINGREAASLINKYKKRGNKVCS